VEKISNRSLISRLYSSAEKQLEIAEFDDKSWSQWYDVIQGLTSPEKMVYVIVKLNKAVTSGGFSSFYETSYGIFAPEIVHALNEINASATADIVSSSLTVVNPKVLLDEAYKDYIFNIQISKEQKEQLHSQDIQYDQLHGYENLEDLLGDYLQNMIN
tara:strand:- start:12 stop:485 length:474 start_codon:yes stop_codon:yes gene_type:complete